MDGEDIYVCMYRGRMKRRGRAKARRLPRKEGREGFGEWRGSEKIGRASQGR